MVLIYILKIPLKYFIKDSPYVGAHYCNPITLQLEARRSWVKASLSYMRPVPKIQALGLQLQQQVCLAHAEPSLASVHRKEDLQGTAREGASFALVFTLRIVFFLNSRLRLASFDSSGKLICSRATGYQILTLEKDQVRVLLCILYTASHVCLQSLKLLLETDIEMTIFDVKIC